MDFQEITKLADQGVIFVGTTLGMTRSNWSDWQHKGTDNINTLKEWVESGYGLVAVASHDHQFVIDEDDPAACKGLGMPEPFLEETYTVDTPSGGEHLYGLHDEVTKTLGNLVVVYAEPGNPNTKKILELKLNGANSVAAPTTLRSGQPKKCDGVYKPRNQNNLVKGLNPEFVLWLRKYGTFAGVRKGKGAAGPKREFHPDFELDEHLEHNEASEAFSYNKNGALHVVSNTCPLNDGPHRDGDEDEHVRDRVTEFIYGKNGWGFSCVVCNVFTKAEFEQKMHELDPEWEPYSYFVYADEDDDLLLSGRGGFEVEAVGDEPTFHTVEFDSAEDQRETVGGSTADTSSKKCFEPNCECGLQHYAPGTEPKYIDPRQCLGRWQECFGDGDDFENLAFVVEPYSEIEAEQLEWTWQDRIPRGKLTLFVGLPGGGKSQAAIHLAACVTTGRDFPDGSKNPNPAMRVLLLTSEDDAADTVKPRLMAAGADCSKVLRGAVVPVGEEEKPADRMLTLKDHVSRLGRILEEHPDIGLVILDPLHSFFGDVNANADQDMVPLMDSVVEMLQKSKATMIGICHLNKKSDVGSMQKILGASAIPAKARAIWGFTKDPEDKDVRYMACVKSSLAEAPNTLVFTIVSEEVPGKHASIKTSRIEWKGDSDEDADDILKRERETSKDGITNRKTSACMAWLMRQFTAKASWPARDLYSLGEEEGFNDKMMRRAKDKLNAGEDIVILVEDRRGQPNGGGWWWTKQMKSEPKLQPIEVGEEL
ncbi:MAG TPA: AAA family ATPase [Verrucomicrobiae bacterium]|nr:AAA family ATPase [Verrucomicrobiae bacterium]